MRLADYLDRVRLLAELASAPDFHALTVADVERLALRQRSIPGFPVDGDMLARVRAKRARGDHR